jgi:acyl-CoA hydrolase
MTELVLPNDTNQLGVLLGGRLMHWIDLAAALAAHRHSRCAVVTASMDHIDFVAPVDMGDFVVLRSSVNRAFHSSMEVGVKAFAENYTTGRRHHVASAYLTFVAIDRQRKPVAVPSIIPETEEENRRYEDALRRREASLETRKRSKARAEREDRR